MQNSKNSDKGQSWLQLPDGYLDKTPMFQFLLVCLIFPLWGAAASLNDILITQFKTVFTLNDTATAFVQSAFYGGYFLLAVLPGIPNCHLQRVLSSHLCHCRWAELFGNVL